jgi:hypothetical protein
MGILTAKHYPRITANPAVSGGMGIPSPRLYPCTAENHAIYGDTEILMTQHYIQNTTNPAIYGRMGILTSRQYSRTDANQPTIRP